MAGKFTKKKKAKKGLLVTMIIIIGLLILAIGAMLVFGGGESQSAYEKAGEENFQKDNEDHSGGQDAQDEQDSKDNSVAVESTAAEDDEAIQGDDISVVNAYIDDEMHLIYVLNNGTEIDMGSVEDNNSNSEITQSYTVRFMDYNGGQLKTEMVAHGKNATPPADPVRSNYIFVGWSDSYTNITSDRTLMAQYTYSGSETKMYTVKFVDIDGSVLKTEVVEKGKNATAPGTPSRSGYSFTGWDKSFENVTANLTVTAQYKAMQVNSMQLLANDVTAVAGQTDVVVEISSQNNPGILGTILAVQYDESVMMLTDAVAGTSLGTSLAYQEPSKLESGCNFIWYGSETGTCQDGVVLTLVFSISESAQPGTYPIMIRCTPEDTFDENYNNVVLDVVNGSITVNG